MSVPTQNDCTGDYLLSKAATDNYRDNYDAIFGKKVKSEVEVAPIKKESKSMNDRELLKMAAKAAGIEIEIKYDTGGKMYAWLGNPVWNEWNPLTDDGDALRLAVKLNINITHSAFGVDATMTGSAISFEEWGADRLSATRRAITRAASEIGRAMQ